jgi:hypothetical protein
MTTLEQELRGVRVAFPAEPDLAGAVRARLGAQRSRRPLVLAFALVAAAVAVAFAVPPARSSLLRWLGLGTARVEFVDKLPDVKHRRPLALGEKVSLSTARDRVSYDVLTSPLLGAPREVRLLGDQIAFVYDRKKLLVMQSEGMFFSKEIGPGTKVEQFVFDGHHAFWISGAFHFFGYVANGNMAKEAPLYLAGNALIWERNGLTLRLEGKLSRAEAIRVARSFH